MVVVRLGLDQGRHEITDAEYGTFLRMIGRAIEGTKDGGEIAGPGCILPSARIRGGLRKLDDPESIRRLAGMDPDRLTELREWLRQSDRETSPRSSSGGGTSSWKRRGATARCRIPRRVASCSKAIRATVLSIASEQSRRGRTPRRMTFDDRAFDFIPWAQPAERSSQGHDHRQAAAESHLGPLPGSDRAPPTTGTGITSWATAATRGPSGWHSIRGPPAATLTHALAHAAPVCVGTMP